MELQGESEFKPAPEVAEYIRLQKHKGAAIRVKFGNVARAGGTIRVAGGDDGKTFHTVDQDAPESIPIDHPFFARLDKLEPRLRIQIKHRAISGWAAPKKTLGSINSIDKVLAEAGPALGLVGFDLGRPNFQNAIEAGVFKLGTKQDIDATLGGWVHMKLGLGLENDVVRFSAKGKVTVHGLAEAELALARDAKGVISGQADLAVTIAKFSGKVTATYVNGEVSVTGTLSYATEKLRGSVTVVVMEAVEAEKAARAQIDPQNLVTETTSDADKKPEKFKKGERGVAGWGELDFAFTDWFTGKAKAIFGPAGYITIIGKIAPPKTIDLMKERAWDTRLFGVDISARYGVPYVADIHVGIGISLGAVARIGPAVLTDIAVEGVYSTDPTVLNAFSITGAFRISAYAGLNLRFEGKAGLTILGHDIDFGAAITGKAGVKGYAEARPTLGYREKADPVAGKKGEYFLKGHLEIAAQPFVGLDGELFVKLDSPWWSPAPDKTWTWPLFSLEYPLPGEFGIGADIDYVIGSDQFPEIKWGKADFDSSKFTDSLLDDKLPPKKIGGDVPKAGAWKGETPPPPTAPPAVPKTDAKRPGFAAPKAGTPAPTGGKGGGQKPEEAAAVAKAHDAAKRFAEGMQALGDLHERAEKDPDTAEEIVMHLDAIKKKFGFTKLDPHLKGNYWVIDAALNTTNKDSKKEQTVRAEAAGPTGKLTFSDLTPGAGEKILLLGEADFSFARSLAAQLERKSVVATSYEEIPGTFERKGKVKEYKGAKENIEAAKIAGAQIIPGVDARKIDPHLGGPPPYFQYIVFNYPMIIADRTQIDRVNREMIAAFLRSASVALKSGGKIYLTSKAHWLGRWRLPEAAKAAGLRCETDIDSIVGKEFDPEEFPGYEHRETHADKPAAHTEKGVTIVFSK